MDNTTSSASREEQPEALRLLGELAVSYRVARDTIAELLELAGDDEDQVGGTHEKYGLSWGVLQRCLAAWDYFLETGYSELESSFSQDVREAMRDAFDFGEDGDDSDDNATEGEADEYQDPVSQYRPLGVRFGPFQDRRISPIQEPSAN